MPLLIALLLLSVNGVHLSVYATPATQGASLSLTTPPKKTSDNILQGSVTTKILRNIRINESIFDTTKRDNLLDTLDIQNTFFLSYATDKSFLNRYWIFNEKDIFFSLSYRRAMYANHIKLRDTCWHSVLCFNNAEIGLSHKLINKWWSKNSDVFYYLTLPVSKKSVTESFLFGTGVRLETQHPLTGMPRGKWEWEASHSLDFNWYMYQEANQKGTLYNVPLQSSHKIELSLNYSKHSFLPELFLIGKYAVYVNMKKNIFHESALGGGGYWNINKTWKIVASLMWGDNFFKTQGTALTPKTTVFSPDKTFFSIATSLNF